MNDRKGTYQAMWFLKKDLKEEKMQLLDSMRDMSSTHLGEVDEDFYRIWTEELSARLEEINRILMNIECGLYEAPEE